MQKKIMIKSFVTIVIVATIVAGHQQKFSDDDVVVKTRQNNEVQTTFEQLKKVCEDVKQKDKIDYVGGSKYVYGADRCMKGEHGTRWTGTCYWAVVTEPKNRETELLKSCGKDNKLRTSGLSKGTSPGAVYLIGKNLPIKAMGSFLW